MKGQLIYSHRYEHPWLTDSRSKGKDTKMSAEEAHRRVEELFRHVEEDSIYVLIPHRMELAEKFVQYVKDFSELEEIDVEIFQTFDQYRATLFLCGSPIIDNTKNSLGELFLMCDDVSVDTSADKKLGYDFAITFTLRTHRHVLDGRAIDFYDETN